MKVTIYGASSADLKEVYYKSSYELGEVLAKRGHSIVFGGGATGVMGSVVRGVCENGGKAKGYAPKFFDKPGILYSSENCEMFYPENMRERKEILRSEGDCIIACAGGIGTYDEFIEAIVLKQLGQFDKPICVYNVDGWFDKMMEVLEYSKNEKFMHCEIGELFSVFDDVNEMLDCLEFKVETQKR